MPQRRSSPQPRHMQNSTPRHQIDGRHRGDGATSGRAYARPLKSSRSKSSSSLFLDDDEKEELTQAVLASFSVVPRGSKVAQYEPPPISQRSDHRNQGRRGSSKAFTKGNAKPSRYSQKPSDLALNRFRFVLSPASCYANVHLKELLSLSSSELWPHVVALLVYDSDPICSICLDAIQAGRALPCGHIFCGVCAHRCLDAAQQDPLLEKCPVCLEGEFKKSALRRCLISRANTETSTYSLVRAIQEDDYPPFYNPNDIVSSRFLVATGEGMMAVVERERDELKEVKEELGRFRDAAGLKFFGELEADLDKAHVEWRRHVGRPKSHLLEAEGEVGNRSSASAIEWTYQRSDGALNFLHPLNLKSLLKIYEGDVDMLPKLVKPLKEVESEEWAEKKFRNMVKLGLPQVPEFPLSVVITEVELDGMTEAAFESVRKETEDRARRREEKMARKVKQELKELQESATIEESRRRQREEEERLLKAYFGYEEEKALREAKEAAEKPKAAHDSFSAVVSNMGHFPMLTKSPKLEQAKAPEPTKSTKPGTPVLEPLKSAWSLPPNASLTPSRLSSSNASSQGHSLLSTSPTEVSYASIITGESTGSSGKKDKVVWSNNPARRTNW